MDSVQVITDPYEITFPKLGWTFHINPTAFKLFGKFDIQWYGIIIVFGLVLAIAYCLPKMKRFGINAELAMDAIIGGIIGGIVGARIYYVAFRWDEYAWNWKEIINTRNGGLAIYGGIIGSLTVGIIICKILHIKILPMLDITVLGFLIGQGIGRWGNFVNQEAFGVNTDSLFGMTGGTIQTVIMRNSSFLDGYMLDYDMNFLEPVHPCFLYESAWCLLGFFILSTYSKHRKYDGQILLMYMAWYGAERFVVEGLRTDSLMSGNLRISQVLSLCICIASIIIQIIMFFRIRRDPEKFILYCDRIETEKKEMNERVNDSIAEKNEEDSNEADNDSNNKENDENKEEDITNGEDN